MLSHGRVRFKSAFAADQPAPETLSGCVRRCAHARLTDLGSGLLTADCWPSQTQASAAACLPRLLPALLACVPPWLCRVRGSVEESWLSLPLGPTSQSRPFELVNGENNSPTNYVLRTCLLLACRSLRPIDQTKVRRGAARNLAGWFT